MFLFYYVPTNKNILIETCYQNCNILIERCELVTPLIEKYQIRSNWIQHILELCNFEIAIVIHDSGSMITSVDDTDRTQWDELCLIVKMVVAIGVIFDSNGIELYFLNRLSFNKVKDPTVIEQAFTQLPTGDTPLASVLGQVFESKLAERGHDKKLLIFVTKDGDQRKKVMREKR